MAGLSFFPMSFIIAFLLCVSVSLADRENLELRPLDKNGKGYSFERRAEPAPGLELVPMDRHQRESSFTKRDQQLDGGFDLSGLDLQRFGTFLWGAEAVSSMVTANLTLEFEEDYEAVVDMDMFAGMVTSVDCTAPDLALEFKDEASFAYAHKVWEWVNTDPEYTFVLVASAHACDAESARQPFLVTDLDFDEAGNKVLMKAELKTWEDIAVTYTFKIRNEPLPEGGSKLRKRDGKTLDFSQDFNKDLFHTKTKGLEIDVGCVNCGISGSVNIDVDIETKWKIPVGASMKVTPHDIAAFLELGLTLGGKLSGTYDPKPLNLVSVPIAGFKISGVFEIGAFLNVDLGFEIGSWEGEAEASVGAKVSIPDDSKLEINILGSGDNEVSGWEPSLDKIPPTISAEVAGSAEAYAQAGFELSAKGLGKGVDVGIDMKMPYIRADFAAVADQEGVCNSRQTLGVEFEASVGAELYASASLNDDPFWEHSIFDKTLGVLADECYGFGPQNAIPGGGGGGDGGDSQNKTTSTRTRRTTSKDSSPRTETSSRKHRTTSKDSYSRTKSSSRKSSMVRTDSNSRKSSTTRKPTQQSSKRLSAISATATPSLRTFKTASMTRQTGDPGHGSKSTLKSTPTPTSSPTSSPGLSCALAKRAKPLQRKGRNTIIGEECVNGITTTHAYTITSLKYAPTAQPTVVQATCKQAYGQACYHYSSAIRNHPQWETLPCPEEAATKSRSRLDAKATSVWTKQHKGDGWKDPSHRAEKNCERDEFPPAYLLSTNDPAFVNAGQDNTGQSVRWLPGPENGRAGGMWKGICFHVPLKALNDKDLYEAAKNKGFGLNTTTISPTSKQYEVGITVGHRPEFTIASWQQKPSQDDGLSDNPCWPKKIAPKDPGFTLLTFDQYYNGAKPPYNYNETYVPGTNGA